MIVLWRLQMHPPMLSCCLLMNQLGPLHLPALGASTHSVSDWLAELYVISGIIRGNLLLLNRLPRENTMNVCV